MKIRHYILVIATLAIIITWFLFRHSEEQSVQQPANATNFMAVTNFTSQVPATNLATSQPLPVSTNTNDVNSREIEQKYRQGLIGKEQAIQQLYLEQNKKSKDFYGMVIDQYGQPIIGVHVNANLILNDGTYGGFSFKKYSTETDNNGRFEFTGINGADLNVLVSKNGYRIGERGEGYKGPAGSKTSSADRAIFTMWKILGPEPLITSGIAAHIPHDGTQVTFDSGSGNQLPNGDFRVMLSQDPLEVQKGWERFNWAVKIEILNGGLVEENDAYPFWAPTNGYQPSFEFSESTNAIKWLGGLQKTFYIKTPQGQYGRMEFKIFPGRSPTSIQASFTINPAGSQNLEPPNGSQ